MTSPRRHLAHLLAAAGGQVAGRPLDGTDAFTRQVAYRLAELAVRPGDVVALVALRPDDVVPAAVAAWQADAVPLFLPQAPERGSVATAVVDADGGVQRLGSGPDAAPPLPATAVLQLTSGSAGVARIARRSVASCLAEAAGYARALDLTRADTVLVPVPPSHSFGWGVAMSALLHGVALRVDPLVRPRATAGLLDAGAVSLVALVPAAAELLLDTARSGPASPRLSLVGAGPLTDVVAARWTARFGGRLLRGYGSTETGGTFVGARGIGEALDGVEVLAPTPGEVGELVLKLPEVVEGYLEPAVPSSDRWHTGDLVRHDGDGCLTVLSRLGGRLRVNGRTVDSGAVEAAARRHPLVRDAVAVVVTRPGTLATEELRVLLETSGPAQPAVAAQVHRDLRTLAPVATVMLCPRLPRTAVGKIDRPAAEAWSLRAQDLTAVSG